MRMDAYYFSFVPTGELYIDKILSAVASAGKAYHHTGDWAAGLEDEMCERDKIQAAAEEAAEYIRWILSRSAETSK